MKQPKLVVMIPALNEEKTIASVIRAVPRKVNGIAKVSVLVVDDGSTDGTLKYAKKAGASILDRKDEEVKGITASVLSGMKEVNTEYFAVMDSDLQHPPEKVEEIFQLLLGGSELVVAWRSSVPGWGFHRRAISLGAEMLGKLRLLIGGNPAPKDILSGFFGGKTKIVRESVDKNPQRFVPEGYKVLFDLLKGMKREGCSISEIPYGFGMRQGGSSKIGGKHFLYFLHSIFS